MYLYYKQKYFKPTVSGLSLCPTFLTLNVAKDNKYSCNILTFILTYLYIGKTNILEKNN